MGLASLLIGILCALTALLTSLTRGKRRDIDDTLIAFAMTWVWAAAIGIQIVTASMGADEGRLARFEAGSVVDLLAGLFIVSRLRHRATIWKWAVAALNLAALMADAAFMLSDRTREAANACKFALNVVFIAQLFCIGFPGTAHVLRSRRVRVPRRLRARIAGGDRDA